MKNWKRTLFAISSLTFLSSCSLFPSGNGNKSKEEGTQYKEELTSCSGKWFLLDEQKQATDTYFLFDGGKGKMAFSYYEDGERKSSGTFSLSFRGNNGENASTLTWDFLREGESKQDWVYCYADGAATTFCQFTTLKEEKEDEMDDGRIYAHVYRIKELPYKMGTYLQEGHEYQKEKDEYSYADTYQIPEGTYALKEGVYFTFLMKKPYSYALFHYQNGEQEAEGVYWTAKDKKTIYLFLEHDPYQYIRSKDRSSYDMTFSHDYPPDFYLRGDFNVDGNDPKIVVNDLYHHEYSPTTIEDSLWKMGTYQKI